ncbi:transposase [Desulfoscipio sp. XC116]|uniref:transposase n=1 Tax=Desulfoscipio sp. XC116 TaxID=3144975 RepID=UPI00325B7A9F
MNLLEQYFKQLVSELRKQGTIDSDCAALNATKLESRKRAKPKKTIEQDGSQPDWGSKNDSHGNQITWFGLKAHLAVDCKSKMLLAVNLTPASRSDSPQILDNGFRLRYQGNLRNLLPLI